MTHAETISKIRRARFSYRRSIKGISRECRVRQILFERAGGAWTYLRTVWIKSRFTKYLVLLDFDQEASFPTASRDGLIADRSFDIVAFNPQSGREILGGSHKNRLFRTESSCFRLVQYNRCRFALSSESSISLALAPLI